MATSSLFSIPSPNAINMANFVTIKLSAESYIAWREQVTGMAGLFHISGFLTGQTPPPQQYKPKQPSTAASSVNAVDDTNSSAILTEEQEETDEYTAWKQTDLFLRSLLIGTMSPEVLSLATGHPTTKDLWYALEQEFARSSYQRSFTLLQQVQNLKKDNSMSVSNHVRQFKVLFDKLTIIGKYLDDDDKVQYLLMSLPSSYKDFITTMMKPPTPTYTEGMFDKERISKLKKGVLIVNNARGAIMDTQAVVDACNSGHIAGYRGDVWSPQPAPKDHPWRYMPNHAMTPHTSGTTIDGQLRYAAGTKDMLDRYFKGEDFPAQNYIVKEGKLASQYQ